MECCLEQWSGIGSTFTLANDPGQVVLRSLQDVEIYMCGFVQMNENSSHDSEASITTPLTSPVKSSRSSIKHTASAPSSVGISGPDSAPAALPAPSDSDESEKNKKKVHSQCLDYLSS